jgi:hypothetical protein
MGSKFYTSPIHKLYYEFINKIGCIEAECVDTNLNSRVRSVIEHRLSQQFYFLYDAIEMTMYEQMYNADGQP